MPAQLTTQAISDRRRRRLLYLLGNYTTTGPWEGAYGVHEGEYVVASSAKRGPSGGEQMILTAVPVSEVIDDLLADDETRELLFARLLTTCELRRMMS